MGFLSHIASSDHGTILITYILYGFTQLEAEFVKLSIKKSS